MRRGDRFNPYSLPDARYRGVEASARFEGLLAQRLPAVGRGVCDGYLYFLFLPVAEQLCDVHGERVAAAAVASGFLSVDVHGTFPVHRPEMEQDVPAFIGFGKFERALIYESRLCVFFEIRIHDAGQGRFYGKGNQYLLVKLRRRQVVTEVCRLLLAVIPRAVERHPLAAFHLWTRIFGPYFVGVDFFTPLAHDGSFFPNPIRSRQVGSRRQGKDGE